MERVLLNGVERGRRLSLSRSRESSPPLRRLKRGLSSLTGTRSSFLAKVRIIVSGSVSRRNIWNSLEGSARTRETVEPRYEQGIGISITRGGELRGTTNGRVISDLLI